MKPDKKTKGQPEKKQPKIKKDKKGKVESLGTTPPGNSPKNPPIPL